MSVSISTVFLKRIATGEDVAAELRDAIEATQIIDWATHWLPVRDRYLDVLNAAQAPASAYPQSAHWNWMDKVKSMRGLLALQSYCLVCEGHTQGMMRIDVASMRCRVESQKKLDLVYVDYLETAPWNWEGPYFDPPRFRRVGPILLRAAVEVSIAEGFKGRTGLHSLPQSADFYRKCGFTDLGPDPNYRGNLPYFEFTPEQAQAFLSQGRRP